MRTQIQTTTLFEQTGFFLYFSMSISYPKLDIPKKVATKINKL